MHFVGAVAPMGTVKLKIGMNNKTTKAFLVIPQHWLDAHEVLKYYIHVLLRLSRAGSNSQDIGSLSATFHFSRDSQDY